MREDIAGLGLWYDIKSSRANSSTKTGEKLERCVQSVQLLSESLERGKSDFELFPQQGTAWNNEVNPRAKKLSVEFELLDPAAPPDALGQWTNTLRFSGVPLPTNEDVLPLQRVMSTPHGTRVVLEKIARRNGLLVVITRLFPPVAVPDMHAQFVGDPYNYYPMLPVATDDRGKDLVGKTPQVIQFDPIDRERPDSEWPFAIALTMPAPDAKTFNLEMKVSESAASLKQWQWFHRVRFDLPPAAIPYAWSPTSWMDRDYAAEVQTPALQATLEAVKPDYGNLQLRFWWRNARKPSIPDRTWRLTKLFGFSGATLDGSVHPHPLFWRIDGIMPQPDERGEAIIIGKKSLTLRLRAQVEAVRMRAGVLDFNALPLPAPDQSLSLNIEKLTSLGTKVILRQISYVATRKPMTGLSALELSNLWMGRHAGCVVVTVEVQGRNKTEVDLTFGGVRDEAGHERDEQWQGAGAQNQKRFLFSIPFPQGARKLNWQLLTREVQPLGHSENITFPEVRLPTKEETTGH